MDTISVYSVHYPLDYEQLVGQNGSYLRYSWRVINQSYSDMTTTVKWSFYCGLQESADINSAVVYYPRIYVDGDEAYRVSGSVTVTKGNEQLLQEGEYTFKHNTTDGTGVFTISVAATLDGQALLAGPFNELVRDIAPYGFLVETMDFTSAQYPEVTYIAPTLTDVDYYMLRIQFFDDEYGGHYAYIDRKVTPTQVGNNTYTFEFADGELDAVYAKMANKTTALAWFHLDTYMNGSLAHENTLPTSNYWTANKFEITDANPLVEPVIVDTNSKTIAVTGDSSKLVRYVSNAQVTVNAQGQAGATITTYRVENGSRAFADSSPVVFKGVEDAIFRFYAKDNRTFITRKNVTVPFVPYVPVSCTISSSIASGDGELNLGVKGAYFTGNFGATENSLSVYFRHRKQNETSFGSWILMEEIVADEEAAQYEAHHIVNNLDYQSTYVFQIHVVDKLTEMYSPETTISTAPIFDWSHSDFNFNVPVTIQGKRFGGDNPILWQGSSAMNNEQWVELSQLVSKQIHGIVLVFSGASGDVSWSTHFVPKEMVTLNQGGGQLFMMGINAGFSTFGGKYLYIYDDSIHGHETNDASGAGASGITYSNNNYVLRYVIGI